MVDGVLPDEDGCAAAGGNPCAAMANSTGTCIDLPAPQTGFKCACKAGFGWDGKACDACVSVVAGVGADGKCNMDGNGGKAIDAHLCNPRDVSVDTSGNIYIVGEFPYHGNVMAKLPSLLQQSMTSAICGKACQALVRLTVVNM
jgi:hypothetical protein